MMNELFLLDPNTIKQVRSVLEHIGLYVGLAVYTAAGAKVCTSYGLQFTL